MREIWKAEHAFSENYIKENGFFSDDIDIKYFSRTILSGFYNKNITYLKLLEVFILPWPNCFKQNYMHAG